LKIIWSLPFERDFRDLPQDIQARAERVLTLLLDNPRHPSLQAKKMQGVKNLWEARVSLSYRITYQFEGERILLRRIGTHDVLRKESK
jgi:mRNA-degrading endonuclease RelE of RelBE toxin-antitoxin system